MTIQATGLSRPMRADVAGRLVTSEGEDRLWESIIHIFKTPRGTRPMDPTFGSPVMVYDVYSSAEAIAYAYGEAIEACEPRVKDVEVTIVSDTEDLLELRFEITPHNQLTPFTRIYDHYRKV